MARRGRGAGRRTAVPRPGGLWGRECGALRAPCRKNSPLWVPLGSAQRRALLCRCPPLMLTLLSAGPSVPQTQLPNQTFSSLPAASTTAGFPQRAPDGAPASGSAPRAASELSPAQGSRSLEGAEPTCPSFGHQRLTGVSSSHTCLSGKGKSP